jgi:hypothetical protein
MFSRRPMPARAIALTFALLGGATGLAGCNQDGPQDDQAYCTTLKADPGFDAAELIDGSAEELGEALKTYKRLQELAPSGVSRAWSTVVRDLESMLDAARGAVPVDQTDYPGFAEAVTLIDQDFTTRCE